MLGDATLPAGEVDDFVIRKKDGFPTYHFAVVVDDELMGVTHVLRAQEHFTNTAKHILLQDALGFRRPTYGHLSIIKNPDDSKMSKRDKDKVLRKAVKEKALSAPPAGSVSAEEWSRWIGDDNVQLDLDGAIRLAEALKVTLPEINVDDFRRSGYLPEVICNFLALNGWSPGHDIEKFDNAFLKERFGLDRVMKTPAKFDRVKLLAFNTDAITGMAPDDFARRCHAHAVQYRTDYLAKLGEQHDPRGALLGQQPHRQRPRIWHRRCDLHRRPRSGSRSAPRSRRPARLAPPPLSGLGDGRSRHDQGMIKA